MSSTAPVFGWGSGTGLVVWSGLVRVAHCWVLKDQAGPGGPSLLGVGGRGVWLFGSSLWLRARVGGCVVVGGVVV